MWKSAFVGVYQLHKSIVVAFIKNCSVKLQHFTVITKVFSLAFRLRSWYMTLHIFWWRKTVRNYLGTSLSARRHRYLELIIIWEKACSHVYVDPKNAVKNRAIDFTEVDSKFWFRPKSGPDRLFGHICLTLSLVFVRHKNFLKPIIFCSVHSIFI